MLKRLFKKLKKIEQKEIVNNYKEPSIFKDFEFAVFSGEVGENAFSHINIWYKEFEKSNMNFLILLSNEEALLMLKASYPLANFILLDNKSKIDDFFTRYTTLKAIFYISNTGNIANFLYQTHLKHIFIGHGDSDKSSSAHKFFRVYDEIWVAGDAHIDRIKNARFNLNGLEFKKVGQPAMLEILEKKAIIKDKKLLYLPTWEGLYFEQDYSSLANIQDIISCIDFKISIKLHPFTGKKIKEYKDLEEKIQNANVIDRKIKLSDVINDYNYFICDISSVITSVLALDCPIFLYMPKDKVIKIAKSNMHYSEYCYVFSNLEEFKIIFKRVIDGDDYLKTNRQRAIEYILNIKDTLNNTFIKELHNLKDIK